MKTVRVSRTINLFVLILVTLSFFSCQTEEIETQEEAASEKLLLNYLVDELGFEKSKIEDKGALFLIDGTIEFYKNDFDATKKDEVINEKASTRTIYRFLLDQNGRHYYRTSFTNQYTYEGTLGRLHTSRVSGTVALHHIKHISRADQLLTRNRNEVTINNNPWFYDGIWGYIYTGSASGRQPVYRYYSSTLRNHFYTINYNELRSGGNGYRYEGIVGYTLR
jgi:hypothetical protein